MDLTYGTVPGAPLSEKTFFGGLQLYLAGKYCINLKMPGSQLNVNMARAITWFVGTTIYCTIHFLMTIHLHLASFYATKCFLKKIRVMLIEQKFKLRRPGPPGHICTPITVFVLFFS